MSAPLCQANIGMQISGVCNPFRISQPHFPIIPRIRFREIGNHPRAYCRARSGPLPLLDCSSPFFFCLLTPQNNHPELEVSWDGKGILIIPLTRQLIEIDSDSIVCALLFPQIKERPYARALSHLVFRVVIRIRTEVAPTTPFN